ncbi:MAG: hypothetical protein M5U27_11965 [Gaiella sp.]|nr:hypothetical protein [Gaiella sp.]
MKRGGGASQGESLAVWATWAVVLGAIFATYWRLPPDTPDATDDLYHVSGNGPIGGLSRVLVELNFPVALVAIVVVLVAMDALPRRAWMVAGPAIALAAVVAWPDVVDQDDLDARVVNAVPALGVALAVGLTVAAARRTGWDVAGRLPLDTARLVVAVALLFLSIPWIAADIGFFLPEGVFVMRRVAPDTDGVPIAAVHLGQHHGFDGALVATSALLLSRPLLRAGKTATVTLALISLAFAYGVVNCVQDAWNEQLAKRGTLDWKIPSAIHPSLTWIWLAILVLAALTALALRREARRVDSPT